MMKTFVQPLAALMTAVFAAGTSLAAEKVIFLGAHPDDSEGYAGTAFLLAKNYEIHMVDLTRGELGLGRQADNDLLWKDVRVFDPGTYELTFTVLTDSPREFSVSVDDLPPVELKVPAKRWTQKVSCRLPFAAGAHTVRIYNEVVPAPAIVEMRLVCVE